MSPNTAQSLITLYHLIHIPVTLLIDSSVIIPKQYHLNLTNILVNLHVSQNKDILLLYPQTWFKTFIFIECIFQLPLFIYFVWKHNKREFDTRYHTWSLIYGFNASFTTFVCMMHIIFEGSLFGLLELEIVKLVGIYSPYLIIPFIILVRSLHHLR